MKLLIAGPLNVTDAVCASVLLRCVKQQLPQAVVHYAATEELKYLFEANPYIDQIEPFAVSVDDADFDYVLDLSGKDVRIKGRTELQHLKPESYFFQKPHKALQYLSAAKQLHIKDDGRGLDYFIPRAAHTRPNDIPTSHSAGFIAVALTDSYPKKVVELLRIFCEQMKHPLMLIGDEDASETASRLRWTDQVKIYNACGKFSQHETADLVRQSKLLVTAESTWLQVAAAFQKKIVALKSRQLKAGYVPPLYDSHFLKAHKNKAVFVLSALPAAFINSHRGAEKLMGEVEQMLKQN